MKKNLVIFILLWLTIVLATYLTPIISNTKNNKTNTQTNYKKYSFVNVIDWDTIRVKNWSWETLSVRMIGLDAPESTTTRYWYTECFWKESSIHLNKLLSWANEIILEIDKTQDTFDKHWRTLAYIIYNWTNINKKMIEDGYGWEYTYSTPYKYQSEFKQAMKKAENKNLWLRNETTCKWERSPVEKEIISSHIWEIKWNISNKWEKIYHIPSCSHYKKTKITTSKWEKWFYTEAEAKSNGWRNCIN